MCDDRASRKKEVLGVQVEEVRYRAREGVTSTVRRPRGSLRPVLGSRGPPA